MGNTQTRNTKARWKEELKLGLLISCGICGLPITLSGYYEGHLLGKLSPDHIIPTSAGGTSRQDNLQPTHYYCNVKKGDKQGFKLTSAQAIGYALGRTKAATKKLALKQLAAHRKNTSTL